MGDYVYCGPMPGSAGVAVGEFDILTTPGLRLCLRGDTYASPAGNGAIVETWQDLSANSLDAVQLTTGDMPLVADINGVAALDFAGSKKMTLPNNGIIGAGNNVVSHSFFVVMSKATSHGAFHHFLSVGTSSARLLWTIENGRQVIWRNSVSRVGATLVPDDGTPVVLWAVVLADGDIVFGYNRDFDNIAAGPIGAIGAGDDEIGLAYDVGFNTHFGNMKVSDLVVVSGALDLDYTSAIAGALCDKLSI